jgi:hypothetical protein
MIACVQHGRPPHLDLDGVGDMFQQFDGIRASRVGLSDTAQRPPSAWSARRECEFYQHSCKRRSATRCLALQQSDCKLASAQDKFRALELKTRTLEA